MSLSSGLIRGCSGASLGFKTEENENVLRIYGFEGEPGGRGEVETRIPESKTEPIASRADLCTDVHVR